MIVNIIFYSFFSQKPSKTIIYYEIFVSLNFFGSYPVPTIPLYLIKIEVIVKYFYFLIEFVFGRAE